ncbi:MAG: response regulator transcription factor [Cocleimonas sp.]|nr:response regulator transcription factor [Cocleimonas sp.]
MSSITPSTIQKKLLIIDDDQLLQTYLASFFERKDYLCDQLVCGECLSSYFSKRDKKPDLILLNVLMAGKNGFYWLNWLTEKYPLIPVIMLTGENKKQDRLLALGSGAVDYINKPFDTDELFLRIQIMMRLHHSSAEKAKDKLSFGPYSYHYHSKKLYSDQDQGNVHLTENEKHLFAILCKNYGEIVSREALNGAIGVKEYHPLDRRIDVHISRLRNKLENVTGKSKYIHVVRNNGYFLRYFK